MTEVKKDEVKVDIDMVNAKVNWIAAALRIIEKKLRDQFGIAVDLDGDGKKGGFSRLAMLAGVAGVAVLVLLGGVAIGETLWSPVLNTTYGTCTVSSASGAATLTVDVLDADTSALGAATLSAITVAVAGTGTNTVTTGANLDASKLSGNTPIASITNALAGNTAKTVGGNITATGTVTAASYTAGGALSTNLLLTSIVKVDGTSFVYVTKQLITQGGVISSIGTALTTNTVALF